MLPDAKKFVGLYPAAFVGNIAQLDRGSASVGAMNHRVDDDGMPVLAADPTVHAIHDAIPLNTRAQW